MAPQELGLTSPLLLQCVAFSLLFCVVVWLEAAVTSNEFGSQSKNRISGKVRKKRFATRLSVCFLGCQMTTSVHASGEILLDFSFFRARSLRRRLRVRSRETRVLRD